MRDDQITTKEIVKTLRKFEQWFMLPNGIAFYTGLLAATRLLELEKFLKSRDAYLVERGLWEDFCKQVEKQDEQ